MILSLDTETTGLDVRHGARAFFVTTCTPAGVPYCWEWPVDPLTRGVEPDPADIEEIKERIRECDTLVMQNGKFDSLVLSVYGIEIPWEKTEDTLIAAHVLASGMAHDLTSLGEQYLKTSIKKFEKALEVSVKKAQGIVRRHYKTWKVAKENLLNPDGTQAMPSAHGESPWKFDMWMPKALVNEWRSKGQDIPEEYQSWETVLEDYSNADSAVTAALWPVMKAKLEQRGLWGYYKEQMKLVPIFRDIEDVGLTVLGKNLREQVALYEEGACESMLICQGVAEHYLVTCPECQVQGAQPLLFCGTCEGKKEIPYPLTFPRGTRNDCLREFAFKHLKLPVVQTTEKGNPSMDKTAIEKWLLSLDKKSRAYHFVKELADWTKRQTAITYMKGYERFWFPTSYEDLYLLNPVVNLTGSATLRKSSERPNEQNISRKENFNLRYCFGPGPGREWWSLDAENIELRLPAYEAQEREMIALFEAPDEPPFYGSNHLLNFSIVYPEIWQAELAAQMKDREHVKKKYKATNYTWGKGGGFAIQYGGQRNTVDAAFHRDGAYDQLQARFSGLSKLNRWCINFAEKRGYIETIPDRNISLTQGYPLMCARTENGSILPTIPLNYRIQGCLQGDSRVWTSGGLLPIQELVGQRVNVWTGFRWAKATAIDKGPCQLARITLESGLVINCDTRHRLKDETDRWLDFDEIQPGVRVALPTVRDPLQPTEEMTWAFLLGFIIGDGHLGKREKRRVLNITVGQKKKEILDSIEAFLVQEGYSKGGYGGVHQRIIAAEGNKAEKYQLCVENSEFAEVLEQMGLKFGWTYASKRVPESIWRSSFQEQRDFLEGLWLSDGARTRNRQLHMQAPALLQDVQKLAASAGFDSFMRGNLLSFTERAFNSKTVRRFPGSRLLELVKRVDYGAYEDKCAAITDKRNFDMAKRGGDVGQFVAERMIKTSGSGDTYRYDRVTGVEILREEANTYTMSVDDPLHQFVADGVVHKNSACYWMRKANVRVYELLQDWNRKIPRSQLREKGYFIIADIHDEMLYSFPKAADPRVNPKRSNLGRIRQVKKLMELGGEDFNPRIPTPVSAEYHPNNWSEGIRF